MASKRFKIIGISLISDIFLLFICYLADNYSHTYFSGTSIGQEIEQIKEYFQIISSKPSDDYLFINIAYDRQLIEVFDDFGFSKGEIDITDRNKIIEFLSRLKDSHRHLIIDILFSDDFKTDLDSILIEQLLNTKRVSISNSETVNLLDSRLFPISGFVDYSSDISDSNFVKYQYLQEGDMSLPYRVYLSENPDNKISQLGPFYFKNDHLIWNCHTLFFPIRFWDENSHKEEIEMDSNISERLIYNLGSDILDTDLDIPSLVKNKIVIIGDFTEDDIHDTYMGEFAGPLININALEALMDNKIEIPWWLIFFLSLFYGLISFLILIPKKLIKIKWFSWKPRNQILQYLLSFVEYSTLFLIVGALIYIFSGYNINIVIPAIWFTILRDFKHFFYEN